MKPISKKNRMLYIGLSLSILLILFGTFSSVRLNQRTRSLLISQQEETLLELVKSTDQNLSNIVSRCQSEIHYLVSGSDFLESEKTFLRNGTRYPLWYALRSNALAESDQVSAVIAMVGDKVYVSTSREYEGDYEFYENLSNENIRICKGPDANYYLAIAFRGDNEYFRYYALVDMRKLYSQIADTEAEGRNEIVLYNEKLNVLIRNNGGRIEVLRLNEISSTAGEKAENADAGIISCYEEIQSRLSENNFKPAAGILSQDPYSGTEKYYFAAYPIETNRNNLFTIALITSYDQMVNPFMALSKLQLLSVFLIAAGLLLMFIIAFRMRKEQEQADQMLEELAEKNRQTEELLKKTKELEHVQRLELLGTMTSGISHEFNNLLTPIMGYSIMSLEMIPEENEELTENIIAVYNASKKAKDIVRQLSELSKKNTSASLTDIEVSSFLTKVISIARPAKPKTVEVDENFNAGRCWFHANETQMTQVFLNLLINAFHATENQPSGVVRISTGRSRMDGEILIDVTDNGCGIPEDILPHIFEPFFTTKEAGKGTGLGLAIAKNVLEELHGSISVKSVPGEGTTFRVTVKEAEVKEESDEAENAEPENAEVKNTEPENAEVKNTEPENAE